MTSQEQTRARARSRAAGRVAFRGAAALAPALVLALAAPACRPHDGAPARGALETPVARPPLTEVLARHTPGWMALPGVVGTYEGADPAGAPVIVVLLAREDRAVRARIPPVVEGWPVRVEVSGPIRALGDSTR